MSTEVDEKKPVVDENVAPANSDAAPVRGDESPKVTVEEAPSDGPDRDTAAEAWMNLAIEAKKKGEEIPPPPATSSGGGGDSVAPQEQKGNGDAPQFDPNQTCQMIAMFDDHGNPTIEEAKDYWTCIRARVGALSPIRVDDLKVKSENKDNVLATIREAIFTANNLRRDGDPYCAEMTSNLDDVHFFVFEERSKEEATERAKKALVKSKKNRRNKSGKEDKGDDLFGDIECSSPMMGSSESVLTMLNEKDADAAMNGEYPKETVFFALCTMARPSARNTDDKNLIKLKTKLYYTLVANTTVTESMEKRLYQLTNDRATMTINSGLSMTDANRPFATFLGFRGSGVIAALKKDPKTGKLRFANMAYKSMVQVAFSL